MSPKDPRVPAADEDAAEEGDNQLEPAQGDADQQRQGEDPPVKAAAGRPRLHALAAAGGAQRMQCESQVHGRLRRAVFLLELHSTVRLL